MPHIGRQQIPLRIAYAITIHKSQGASIDSAIVDIGKSTFEYGQAYVALSRVRSLEGLHIFALDMTKIKTHPRVLEFYKKLKSSIHTSYI
jgi:ATP-dependent DNA helicase PIF1